MRTLRRTLKAMQLRKERLTANPALISKDQEAVQDLRGQYKRSMRALPTLAAYILLVSFTQFRQAGAHSHLANPLPTRELHCRVGAQHGRDCYGPCPLQDTYGRLNHPWINEHNPAETWGRGQMINVRWHRDNHDGTGFVRLTLVPVSKMMDKRAHEKFAFQFLCMNSGLHKCVDTSYDTCGNDVEGMAWQAEVRVPTSYPDGVYVFGWSWYGGGDYRGMSFFGDYYSCSFVEIRGGGPVMNWYVPVYDGRRCVSSTDRLGVCWREPCNIGGMYEMIPAEFNNRVPAAIRREWLEEESESPGLGSAVASANTGSSGSSVSLGARSSGGTGGRAEGSEERTFNAEMISSGGLGVYFLNFTNWKKLKIVDGGRYFIRDFPKGLTVEAFYNGRVKFIDFFFNGDHVRREKSAPFVMNGNRGERIFPWKVPIGRMVKVQVSVTSCDGRTEGFEADFEFE